eukprot:m.199593 g.199593  ORF g.199593 m.199593 type:complete len:1086 (+) comp16847_c1_seq3:83-3340(+)
MKPSERVDWRRIVGLDVQQATPEILQSILHNIAFCDIQAEHLDGVDENFVKLFQLAQLCVRYVLDSQENLLQEADTLKRQLQRANEDKQLLARKYAKAKANCLRLQQSFQTLSSQSKRSVFQCRFCGKTFVSQSHAIAHMTRNHRDLLGLSDPLEHVVTLQVSDKETVQETRLQDEVEGLKRELANSRQQLQEAQTIHNEAVRKLEEKMREDADQRERHTRLKLEEIEERHEATIRRLQSQMSADLDAAHAHRTRLDDKHQQMTFDHLSPQLERLLEVNRHLQQQQQQLQLELQAVKSSSQQQPHPVSAVVEPTMTPQAMRLQMEAEMRKEMIAFQQQVLSTLQTHQLQLRDERAAAASRTLSVSPIRKNKLNDKRRQVRDASDSELDNELDDDEQEKPRKRSSKLSSKGSRPVSPKARRGLFARLRTLSFTDRHSSVEDVDTDEERAQHDHLAVPQPRKSSTKGKRTTKNRSKEEHEDMEEAGTKPSEDRATAKNRRSRSSASSSSKGKKKRLGEPRSELGSSASSDEIMDEQDTGKGKKSKERISEPDSANRSKKRSSKEQQQHHDAEQRNPEVIVTSVDPENASVRGAKKSERRSKQQTSDASDDASDDDDGEEHKPDGSSSVSPSPKKKPERPPLPSKKSMGKQRSLSFLSRAPVFSRSRSFLRRDETHRSRSLEPPGDEDDSRTRTRSRSPFRLRRQTSSSGRKTTVQSSNYLKSVRSVSSKVLQEKKDQVLQDLDNQLHSYGIASGVRGLREDQLESKLSYMPQPAPDTAPIRTDVVNELNDYCAANYKYTGARPVTPKVVVPKPTPSLAVADTSGTAVLGESWGEESMPSPAKPQHSRQSLIGEPWNDDDEADMSTRPSKSEQAEASARRGATQRDAESLQTTQQDVNGGSQRRNVRPAEMLTLRTDEFDSDSNEEEELSSTQHLSAKRADSQVAPKQSGLRRQRDSADSSAIMPQQVPARPPPVKIPSVEQPVIAPTRIPTAAGFDDWDSEEVSELSDVDIPAAALTRSVEHLMKAVGGVKPVDTQPTELQTMRRSLKRSSFLATDEMQVSSATNSEASVLEDPPLPDESALNGSWD